VAVFGPAQARTARPSVIERPRRSMNNGNRHQDIGPRAMKRSSSGGALN